MTHNPATGPAGAAHPPDDMAQGHARLLRDHLAWPGRDGCRVARCWRDITDEALEAFAERLQRVPAETLIGDVVECLNNVVAGLAPGSTLADEVGAPLLVQMALVSVNRWLRAKTDLDSLSQGGVPALPMLEDAVAALVAASCLGLNLKLALRINSLSQPEIEIANLLTDREELQVGCLDAKAATGRALLKRALSSIDMKGGLKVLPTDSLIADQVTRHARRSGARLIVGLPSGEEGLARHVIKQWSAGAFLRADLQPGADAGPAHPLLALQNDVKVHLDAVRAVLSANSPALAAAGSPSRQDTASSEQPLVFISYAHEDLALRQEFEQHLKTYVVNGTPPLALWTDDMIGAGEQWQAKILQGINQCKVAVFLLTHHFMASDFIMNSELPLLGARYDSGAIRIVPILMSPCDAGINRWLAARQVVPSIETPVPGPTAGHPRTQALVDFAKTVNLYARTAAPPRNMA